MKNVKILIMLLAMAMAIFLMAGCGANASGGASNGNASVQEQTQEQTEGALHEDEANHDGEAVHNTDAADTATAAAEQHNDGDIGIEAVKAIALAKVAGATEADIYGLESEYDDGRLEYEGSIYFGGYEYEFEIDAATGNILAWEIDD